MNPFWNIIIIILALQEHDHDGNDTKKEKETNIDIADIHNEKRGKQKTVKLISRH